MTDTRQSNPAAGRTHKTAALADARETDHQPPTGIRTVPSETNSRRPATSAASSSSFRLTAYAAFHVPAAPTPGHMPLVGPLTEATRYRRATWIQAVIILCSMARRRRAEEHLLFNRSQAALWPGSSAAPQTTYHITKSFCGCRLRLRKSQAKRTPLAWQGRFTGSSHPD